MQITPPSIRSSAGEPCDNTLDVRAGAAILETRAGATRGSLHDRHDVDLAGTALARDLDHLLVQADRAQPRRERASRSKVSPGMPTITLIAVTAG
jgi:hypothetical protein